MIFEPHVKGNAACIKCSGQLTKQSVNLLWKVVVPKSILYCGPDFNQQTFFDEGEDELVKPLVLSHIRVAVVKVLDAKVPLAEPRRLAQSCNIGNNLSRSFINHPMRAFKA